MISFQFYLYSVKSQHRLFQGTLYIKVRTWQNIVKHSDSHNEQTLPQNQSYFYDILSLSPVTLLPSCLQRKVICAQEYKISRFDFGISIEFYILIIYLC